MSLTNLELIRDIAYRRREHLSLAEAEELERAADEIDRLRASTSSAILPSLDSTEREKLIFMLRKYADMEEGCRRLNGESKVSAGMPENLRQAADVLAAEPVAQVAVAESFASGQCDYILHTGQKCNRVFYAAPVIASPEARQSYVLSGGEKNVLASALMKSVKVVSPWVSVDERLPEKDGMYLALRSGDALCELCAHIYDKGKWLFGDGSDMDERVTHWMPIPALPESSSPMNKDSQ